jgi:hypothetical protein
MELSVAVLPLSYVLGVRVFFVALRPPSVWRLPAVEHFGVPDGFPLRELLRGEGFPWRLAPDVNVHRSRRAALPHRALTLSDGVL